jgi:hypothetical protein
MEPLSVGEEPQFAGDTACLRMSIGAGDQLTQPIGLNLGVVVQ